MYDVWRSKQQLGRKNAALLWDFKLKYQNVRSQAVRADCSHKCSRKHVAAEMCSHIKRKFCNVRDKHMFIGQWSFDTAKSENWGITKSRPVCCDVCRWPFHLTCYTFGCTPWIMDLTLTTNTEECVNTCRLRKYDPDIHIGLEVRFP
jgi:hypothetical protein